MGFIESASERYPTGQGSRLQGKTIERGGGVPNMLSILFSSSLTRRIDAWYCLNSSSFGEISSKKVGQLPNQAMACPIEVSQNRALGP